MRPLPANFIIGAVLVALVVGIAALSTLWTPHDPTTLNIRGKFGDPSAIN